MNAGPLLSAGLTVITTINALYMVLHMTLDKLDTKEIRSKTFFAQFRFCYCDDDYYKWYLPF